MQRGRHLIDGRTDASVIGPFDDQQLRAVGSPTVKLVRIGDRNGRVPVTVHQQDRRLETADRVDGRERLEPVSDRSRDVPQCEPCQRAG